MIELEDLLVGARFLRRLPGFLRTPIGAEESREILGRRFDRREADFLTVVKQAVYGHPGSPYRQLLAAVGCEYGDLERQVTRDGIEGVLRTLLERGVYLTVEELKGRRPVSRAGVTIAVNPTALHNPASVGYVSGQSSGSRGARTLVASDFEFIRDVAVNRSLALAARGDRAWRVAFWDVPGGALRGILAYAKGGLPPVRWFTPVDPAAPGLHPRYRWSARLMRWGSLLAAVPLPAPHHVPVNRPLPIARWMAEVLRAGATPFLCTYPSPAVRLCRAALDAGVRLDGALMGLYGEPITDARLAVIRRAGAEAAPLYVTTESSRAGEACLAPEFADEVHLFDDLHALIQPGPRGEKPGLSARALLLSSLRLTAPLILLNASMGDQATVVRRQCGCAMERLGWRTHLHTIRSYEKLTAGGMTFLDADVIRVLDEVLPSRFGGAPTDYQLVEGEEEDGAPCVRLFVDPSVGRFDADAIRDAFLAAIGGGAGAERVMGLVWRDAGLPHVERRPPRATDSGKILHVHLEPGTAPTPPPVAGGS